MKKKVLIIGSDLMIIYHHRIDLIVALIQKGYAVAVVSPPGDEERKLREIGCEVIRININNRGTNVLKDLKSIYSIFRKCNAIRPDIILTFYTKTNIYGGLVARLTRTPYIVNITGLGAAHTKKKIFGALMRGLYKEAVKNCGMLFFQNESNVRFFREKELYSGKSRMLPGSGVNLNQFCLLPYPEELPVNFLFISRLLREKGLPEYIEAARIVKSTYPDTIFYVTGPFGDTDMEYEVKKALDEGLIEYHGKIDDIHEVLKGIHATVLPSYYAEGMANVLLESAASGRPVITTEMPGCRETVEHNRTGFIVKPQDPQDLANAMMRFISMPASEKKLMGVRARNKMEREFNREIVTKAYIETIGSILSVEE